MIYDRMRYPAEMIREIAAKSSTAMPRAYGIAFIPIRIIHIQNSYLLD